MKKLVSKDSESKGTASGWWWVIAFGCIGVLFIAILSPRERSNPGNSSEAAAGSGAGVDAATSGPASPSVRISRSAADAGATKAERIVAEKIRQFGQSRREIVYAIARGSGKTVPSEVEEFFDAIEGGDWEQIYARWQAMASRSGQYSYGTHDPALDEFWPAVLEAYGAAEQAHLWPAQKLLDYGNAILDSLRPGMVYVGGTDEGRFIPTFLNETSGGEKHIVITQNALADGRYLEYVNFLYADRFAPLRKSDSDEVFKHYVDDAQERLLHDQQFPDEPKQIRPGEDVKMVDGKVQVGGQVAVMTINENLLRVLMEKNPELSFALQESFPFSSTYGTAAPLGPIMELGAHDNQKAITAESAAQSIEYWRSTARELLANPEAAGSEATMKSFAHLAFGQANLLAGNNYLGEAEQGYRLATSLFPGHVEANFGLADLLARSGRNAEASQVLDSFAASYPDKRAEVDKRRASMTLTLTP